jgi:hypothetical protein
MKYLTIEELIKSDTAKSNKISNIPSSWEKDCLIALIENVLDPLREAYGKPIIVTSGLRCEKLNNLVKGAKTSQHRFGQAADIRSKEDTKEENKKLFDLIIKLNLPFDQLIDEKTYSWIHISFSKKPRKQVLHL